MSCLNEFVSDWTSYCNLATRGSDYGFLGDHDDPNHHIGDGLSVMQWVQPLNCLR